MPILSPEESLELFMRSSPGGRTDDGGRHDRTRMLENEFARDGRAPTASAVDRGGDVSYERPDLAGRAPLPTDLARREEPAARAGAGPGSVEPEDSPAQMRDPLDVFTGLQERVHPMVEQMYPRSPLSDEEMLRLGELERREARLAPAEPIPFGAVGSQGRGRFGTDTRGAAHGLGNLGVAIINRVREGRRDEFADELGELRGQVAQDRAAVEGRESFYEEFFPELLTETMRQERDHFEAQERADRFKREEEYRKERDEARDERTRELIDKRHELDTERIQLRHELQSDPSNPENQRRYVNAVNRQIEAEEPFFDINKSRLDQVNKQIDELNALRSPSNHQQEQLNSLREEEKELRRKISQSASRISSLYDESGMALDIERGADVGDLFDYD